MRCILSGNSTFRGSICWAFCWAPPHITLSTQIRSLFKQGTPLSPSDSAPDINWLPLTLRSLQLPGYLPVRSFSYVPNLILTQRPTTCTWDSTICLISEGVCSFSAAPEAGSGCSPMSQNIYQGEFLFSRREVRRSQVCLQPPLLVVVWRQGEGLTMLFCPKKWFS